MSRSGSTFGLVNTAGNLAGFIVPEMLTALKKVNIVKL